jgi:two-component system, cell cycle sensor histidine kinase and response regulator CckA
LSDKQSSKNTVDGTVKHSLPSAELIGNSGHDWQHWLDSAERLQWVNPAVERITGYTPEECYAMGDGYPHDILHPDDRHLMRNHLKEICDSRGGACTRFRIVTKSEELRWIEACCQCMRDENTQDHIGFHGLMRDITNEKKARQELRQSRERLDLVLWSTRQGYWDWNVDDGTLYYNARLAEMLDIPPADEASEAPRADWWLERVHADDRESAREKFMRHLANETLEFETELRMLRASGSYFWAGCRGCVVERDPSGAPLRFVGTVMDITDRKFNELRQRKLEKQLRHALKMESLGIMAGGIAHDFNNLLMAIMGNAQLIYDAVERNSPLRGGLQQILDASNRAADLSHQMLAYSGKGRLLKRQICLNEMVNGLRDVAQSTVGEQAALVFDLCEAQIPLRADSSQLRDVLTNLLSNAAEAFEDGPGVVTVHTSVRHCRAEELESRYLVDPLPEGKYGVLEVIDNGAGMSEDAMDKIFDPFFTTKFMGRGLGLAVVMGIAISHDGLVQVESEHRRGSTFRLLLPVHERPAATEVIPAQISAPIVEKDNATILLIEDEQPVREVCKALLEHMHYRVVEAEGGREGAEILKANPTLFDCAMLDYSMPDMDGNATYHLLHEIRPDLPIVVASGHSQDDILDEFVPGELAGFVQKPFRLEVIQEILNEVISGKNN